MQEKSKTEQPKNNQKQTKQDRYKQKHNICKCWIKSDLKELFKKIGSGSIIKGSEIALDALLRDGSICKMILTNKSD